MNPLHGKPRRIARLTSAAAALVMATSLAACSGSSSGGGSSSDDPLRISIASDVVSLDPQLQGDLTSMSVADNIFDTLTVRDADNKLSPGLATKWEQVDPLTWRFTIRTGVKFQNGEALDANAVAYSINRLLDPATKSPIVELVNVKQAKAVDATTVDFQMKTPDPVIPAKVSLFGGVIVPPKYIEEKGADGFAQHPVGSGPYEFVSRKRDNEIVLKANPTYWGSKPKIKNVVFKVMPTPASAVAALQSGEVDIITGVTKDAMNQLGSGGDTKVQSKPGIRTYTVNMDTRTDGPLSKKEVRTALNYAVDAPTLIKTVMAGDAKRTATMIPEGVFGLDPSVKPFEHDPAKAKQLLADAGYPKGFSTTISASSVDSSLVQAISGQLAEVGVKAKVRLIDPVTAKSEIITLNGRKDGGMYLFANSGWTLDATSFTQSVLKSDRRSSRWSNDTADKLVTTEETSVDSDERKKAFSDLQKLLVEESPYVYLFAINNTYATRSNIDWTMPVTGIFALSSASRK
ncbi:ABC transporter substrate-binding protein [Aeromicrobium chenweiae]|uniref:ABC transporter substrate-binding protein n=1 Tax=Aeromicrobium chenweiae TaxID=2079793 RepID=A0A2S0WHT7_9ACTN|nr:ABC transporter substrate-binding protein [Aeromicrobium chenweiae]AWB90854.1 ABC transporter substrate-binding protein [Aeromicrobium chenweiae]TGN31117.1 ABC transporter substrate-binding protein [Aeromicrobium chenweiae]